MSIKSWTRSSYSFGNAATVGAASPLALTTSFQAFAIGTDTTNSPESELFPDVCNIQSVEFEFTTKGDAVTVTMYIARDSAGKAAVTPGGTTGASQTLLAGADGTASAVYSVDTDYHFDSGVSSTTSGTIYVMAKVNDNTGNPVSNIRINWRG